MASGNEAIAGGVCCCAVFITLIVLLSVSFSALEQQELASKGWPTLKTRCAGCAALKKNRFGARVGSAARGGRGKGDGKGNGKGRSSGKGKGNGRGPRQGEDAFGKGR